MAEASPAAGGRDWGWVGVFWPAPSISEGSGLTCAVVPPAHPPTFLGTGGLPLYPRRGLRPLHPAWEQGGRRLLTWRDGTLPDLSPGTRAGTAGLSRGEGALFDCMLVTPISRISGFADVEPLQRRYKPLQGRYESLRSWMAPVPTFLGGSCPWGVPSAPLPQGDSLWLAPSAHVCGRLREREAGRGPTHGDTIARPFVFCNGGWGRGFPRGGWQGLGMGGLVVACALLQRGDWLGLRRCPTCPPSNVFGYRGTPPVPPAGAAPPCTLLGEMRKAPSFHLAHRPTLLETGGLTILPRKQRPLRPA